MKTALIYKYGQIEQILVEETNKPLLSKGEVLVKVCAAGLNPKDILVRKGKFKRFTGTVFPLQMSYEFAGFVNDSNGSGLFHKGDHVFGMINGWKGRCCAEYVNVDESELFYIPKNLTNEEASGLPLAGQTALQALRDLGKLKQGNKVCINGGSGGVGTLAIQIAKILGAHVTAITSHRNTELCTSLGANEIVDYTSINITESKEKFDIFFDVYGNYSFKKTKHLLKPKGIYITTVPQKEIFKEQLWSFFRRKKAKLVFVKSKSIDLKWITDHVESEQLKPVIDEVYTLDEIQLAHYHIESKRSRGKVIVQVSES